MKFYAFGFSHQRIFPGSPDSRPKAFLNSASNSLRYSTMKSPIIVHVVSMHKVFLDSPFKNLYFVEDERKSRVHICF
jgi:hypothetical protein